MLLKAGNTPTIACVLQRLYSQEHGVFVSKCDTVETPQANSEILHGNIKNL